MPEAEVHTALLHVAATAIHPPDQVVTATDLTVRQAGSLQPVRTAPVVAVREPIPIMVPTEATPVAPAITTTPAQVLAAIQLPPRRRVPLRLQLEELQLVTEQRGPVHQVHPARQEHQQLLRVQAGRRIVNRLLRQHILPAVRLQVLLIHLPPVQTPVLVRAPAQVQVAHAAVVHQ